VELLVVITIIGMLVALLLPAVTSTIGEGRRTYCQNNMQNLAKAMLEFESAKGRFPGYSQLVKRSATEAVAVRHSSTGPNWTVITVNAQNAIPISWAAMLLPKIERQDIWDSLQNPKVDADLPPAQQEGVLDIRPIELLVCPSDTDALAAADTPALSYSVNAGAPDWDVSQFLAEAAGAGDTIANGVFHNLYEYGARRLKAPLTRLSTITDGAGTTILLAENCHKSYEPVSTGDPARFTWLFGTEQHLGIVWVVSTAPQPGNSIVDQERINRVGDDAYSQDPVFDPNSPRFARPASNHGPGVNIAFVDGHSKFLSDNIEYVVYQQLLSAQGKKCVDPAGHNLNLSPGDPIHMFRNAPPLSEADFQ
jgi:prepilin-type processing-associated H-X9-DG protein